MTANDHHVAGLVLAEPVTDEASRQIDRAGVQRAAGALPLAPAKRGATR